jgi:hypothetical protein
MQLRRLHKKFMAIKIQQQQRKRLGKQSITTHLLQHCIAPTKKEFLNHDNKLYGHFHRPITHRTFAQQFKNNYILLTTRGTSMKRMNYACAFLLLICAPSLFAAEPLQWGHDGSRTHWNSTNWRRVQGGNKRRKAAIVVNAVAKSPLNPNAAAWFPNGGSSGKPCLTIQGSSFHEALFKAIAFNENLLKK